MVTFYLGVQWCLCARNLDKKLWIQRLEATIYKHRWTYIQLCVLLHLWLKFMYKYKILWASWIDDKIKGIILGARQLLPWFYQEWIYISLEDTKVRGRWELLALMGRFTRLAEKMISLLEMCRSLAVFYECRMD